MTFYWEKTSRLLMAFAFGEIRETTPMTQPVHDGTDPTSPNRAAFLIFGNYGKGCQPM